MMHAFREQLIPLTRHELEEGRHHQRDHDGSHGHGGQHRNHYYDMMTTAETTSAHLVSITAAPNSIIAAMTKLDDDASPEAAPPCLASYVGLSSPVIDAGNDDGRGLNGNFRSHLSTRGTASHAAATAASRLPPLAAAADCADSMMLFKSRTRPAATPWPPALAGYRGKGIGSGGAVEAACIASAMAAAASAAAAEVAEAGAGAGAGGGAGAGAATAAESAMHWPERKGASTRCSCRGGGVMMPAAAARHHGGSESCGLYAVHDGLVGDVGGGDAARLLFPRPPPLGKSTCCEAGGLHHFVRGTAEASAAAADEERMLRKRLATLVVESRNSPLAAAAVAGSTSPAPPRPAAEVAASTTAASNGCRKVVSGMISSSQLSFAGWPDFKPSEFPSSTTTSSYPSLVLPASCTPQDGCYPFVTSSSSHLGSAAHASDLLPSVSPASSALHESMPSKTLPQWRHDGSLLPHPNIGSIGGDSGSRGVNFMHMMPPPFASASFPSSASSSGLLSLPSAVVPELGAGSSGMSSRSSMRMAHIASWPPSDSPLLPISRTASCSLRHEQLLRWQEGVSKRAATAAVGGEDAAANAQPLLCRMTSMPTRMAAGVAAGRWGMGTMGMGGGRRSSVARGSTANHEGDIWQQHKDHHLDHRDRHGVHVDRGHHHYQGGGPPMFHDFAAPIWDPSRLPRSDDQPQLEGLGLRPQGPCTAIVMDSQQRQADRMHASAWGGGGSDLAGRKLEREIDFGAGTKREATADLSRLLFARNMGKEESPLNPHTNLRAPGGFCEEGGAARSHKQKKTLGRKRAALEAEDEDRPGLILHSPAWGGSWKRRKFLGGKEQQQEDEELSVADETDPAAGGDCGDGGDDGDGADALMHLQDREARGGRREEREKMEEAMDAQGAWKGANSACLRTARRCNFSQLPAAKRQAYGGHVENVGSGEYVTQPGGLSEKWMRSSWGAGGPVQDEGVCPMLVGGRTIVKGFGVKDECGEAMDVGVGGDCDLRLSLATQPEAKDFCKAMPSKVAPAHCNVLEKGALSYNCWKMFDAIVFGPSGEGVDSRVPRNTLEQVHKHAHLDKFEAHEQATPNVDDSATRHFGKAKSLWEKVYVQYGYEKQLESRVKN